MDELFMSAKDEAKAKRALLETKIKGAILMYREVTKEAKPETLVSATNTMKDCVNLVPAN